MLAAYCFALSGGWGSVFVPLFVHSFMPSSPFHIYDVILLPKDLETPGLKDGQYSKRNPAHQRVYTA